MLVALLVGLAYNQYALRQQVARLRLDVASAQTVLVRDGRNSATIRGAVAQLQRDTAAMRATTRSVAWTVGAQTPFLGGSLRAVRSLAQAGDDTSRRVLPVLTATALQLRSGPREGPLDVRAITDRRESLDASLRQVKTSQRQLARDDVSDPAGRRAHDEFVGRLGQLRDVLSTLSTVAHLGPGMSGQQGDRRYLVILQSPAESRGTGGIVGGFLDLKVSLGAVKVVRSGSNHDLQPGRTKVAVDGGFARLWGPVGAQQQWYASNLSLDFPSVAKVWSGLYSQQYAVPVDGVLGVTPEAVARLLELTGPLRLPGGVVLNRGDAARALEVDLYRRFPTVSDESARNTYQLEVLRALLRAVLTPRPLGKTYVDVLRAVAHDGSLRLASTHPLEQAELQPTAVGGALPRDGRPFVAWSTNNAAGSKLDVYLHRSLSYRRQDRIGGGEVVHATAVLRNDAPARGLPPYVTIRADLARAERTGAAPGSEKLVVATYLTAGARVTSVTVDGRPVRYGGGSEWGHPVVTVPVVLQPGGGTDTVVVTAEQPADRGPVTTLRQPVAVPDELSLP